MPRTTDASVLGTRTDPKNAATDATSVSALSALKQISASAQAAAASLAGTLTVTGGSGGSGDASAAKQDLQVTQETAINTVLGTKTDAKSIATDATSVSAVSVLKQISASVQVGTVADGADVTQGAKADARSTASDATPITAMQVLKQVSFNGQIESGHLNNVVGALGTQADSTYTGGSGTMIAIMKAVFGKIPVVGSTTASNSLPVTLSSDGPFVTQTGSLTETAPATDTASSGLNGRMQRLAQRITSLIALLPASLGRKAAASSLAVVLSTEDLAAIQAITGGGGAVTLANGADVTQGAIADTAWVSGNGTVISLLKKIASAGGGAVSVADGADVTQGASADSAWVSGNGTVISLLKKIASGAAASLSSIYNSTPPTYTDGQTTTLQTDSHASLKVIQTAADGSIIVPLAAGSAAMASAMPVTIATDDTMQKKVIAASATATLTNLASSTTSAQVLASTAGRFGVALFNDDANAVYIKYGTTASATSYTVKIPTDSYWEMPSTMLYTGRIDAVWVADGAGSLRITELTA